MRYRPKLNVSVYVFYIYNEPLLFYFTFYFREQTRVSDIKLCRIHKRKFAVRTHAHRGPRENGPRALESVFPNQEGYEWEDIFRTLFNSAFLVLFGTRLFKQPLERRRPAEEQCAKECYALHTLCFTLSLVLCNVCILYFRVLVHVVRV